VAVLASLDSPVELNPAPHPRGRLEGFMESKPNIRPTPQLVLGLLIIVVGVLFTLDNLYILPIGNILRFWPLALMAIGLAKFFDSDHPAGFIAAALFFGIGSILLLQNLNVFHVRLWSLWPIILVVIGGGMLWQAMTRDRDTTGNSDTHISVIALLGGVQRTFRQPEFRGGDLTAIMGGCEIDLRDTSILEAEAVLEVFVMWGGIEVRIPDDWVVEMHGLPLLGGFGDSTRTRHLGDATRSTTGALRKRLIIKGLVIMGGVEIKN
jgi:predicted membrane protein